MSSKRQIPSLCELYSFYRLPEEVSDETDADSSFYHKLFDISQSQHRIVIVCKISNEKSFAFKLFQFCDSKTQQRYILQEELNSLVKSLRDFLKTFDTASQLLQVLLEKPLIEIGYTKSMDNVSAHYCNDTIESPKTQTRLSFCFGNNISSVSSIKKFILHGNHFFYSYCQFSPSWNSPSLQEPIMRCKQMWNIWEQLRCVVHSPLILGPTIALFFLLGTCFVQKQSVRMNFAD